MSKTIALDFDGVICDSAGECLFSAYNTYATIRKLDAANSVKDIRKDWYDAFYEFRPFIRDGKDYFVILYFLDNDISISNQQDFDAESDRVMSEVCRLANVDAAGDLEKHFQESRRAIRAKDESAWFALNPLYPFMRKGLLSLAPEYTGVYITTSKPTDAATKILYHNGIKIPEQQILGKDKVAKSKAKNSQMEAVALLAGVALADIHFLDDQVSHLKASRDIGVQCFMATWGYNTDEQIQQAQDYGCVLLSADDAADWLTV